jgi:hypothetical protein
VYLYLRHYWDILNGMKHISNKIFLSYKIRIPIYMRLDPYQDMSFITKGTESNCHNYKYNNKYISYMQLHNITMISRHQV